MGTRGEGGWGRIELETIDGRVLGGLGSVAAVCMGQNQCSKAAERAPSALQSHVQKLRTHGHLEVWCIESGITLSDPGRGSA